MIDLRNLRHFVVLAKHLHYIRAADELGITQPTLTRSIQALERQLATRLFDRDRGGVSLTPQGRLIAERATLLLTEAEDLEQQSRLTAQGEGGRVRFGMTPMPARALLSRLLSDRLTAAPGVTNAVVVRDVEALWGMLLAGEIEFFVSSERPLHDLSPAQVELLCPFSLSVIVRPGHPLLGEAPADARFPLLRSSWAGVSIPERIAGRILGEPNIIEDFATLAEVTAATDAMWFASTHAIAAELAAGTLVELFRARAQVEVSLYSLARRSRSPLAEAIAGALRAQVAAIDR